MREAGFHVHCASSSRSIVTDDAGWTALEGLSGTGAGMPGTGGSIQALTVCDWMKLITSRSLVPSGLHLLVSHHTTMLPINVRTWSLHAGFSLHLGRTRRVPKLQLLFSLSMAVKRPPSRPPMNHCPPPSPSQASSATRVVVLQLLYVPQSAQRCLLWLQRPGRIAVLAWNHCCRGGDWSRCCTKAASPV